MEPGGIGFATGRTVEDDFGGADLDAESLRVERAVAKLELQRADALTPSEAAQQVSEAFGDGYDRGRGIGGLEPIAEKIARRGAPVLLALDPGLANFGAAVIGARGELVESDVLATEAAVVPLTAAQKARRKAESAAAKARGERRKAQKRAIKGGVIADRDRRIGEIWSWLMRLATRVRPVALVAEAPGGGKTGFQAAISTSSASTIAAIAAIELGVPMIRVNVQAWRRVYAPGVRKIDDEALYRAIGPAARAFALRQLGDRGRSASLLVHALDSIGIGRWAVDFSTTARRALGVVTAEGL